MKMIMIVPKVVQNYIAQFPESVRNAYKYFNYDRPVVEERVQRADCRPKYKGPNDLTNADYDALVTYAKTKINPILAKYSPVVACEDALNLAIRSFNNGQFDGKVDANHFCVLAHAMRQPAPVMAPMAPAMAPGVPVMAKKAPAKKEAPKKDQVVQMRTLKQLGIDPRKIVQKSQLSRRPDKGLVHLLKKPGKGIILKKSAEGGAPNEYLVDFLSLIAQLPTKDYEVIRKLVGRWKQSKVLVKEFLQDAVKEAGIDPEYAQKIAEDFKIAAPVMDKLEVLYDKFGDAMGEMDKIKTHFEPLQDLVQKIQSKSEQEQAPAEPSPTDESAMAPEDNTEEPVTTEK
jgi:hypothetical protein